MRFDNLGTTDAFFAESVADELISELSRTPSLDVIARSSSFPLSGASATPANVARVLGATLVLTGSVQRAGESLRVHADLVEAPSGRELWNRTFQRPLSDVLLLQRDIAVEVARSVGLRVESHEARHVDPEAYDLYLRGRELYLHRLEGRTREARDLFQQAVQRDPNFAQAWVWYGAASQQVTGDETYNQPQTLTMYAAALDAAAQVERLEPTWADSAQLRSDTYATVGQWLEAARYGRRSEALGLAQYTWRMNTGGARRLVETWRHTLALNPQNENMHAFFGSACIAAGDYVCAVDMERRALELNPRHPYAIFWLFDATRRTDREAARRLLSQYPEAWRASFASDASNKQPHLLSLLGGPAVPVAELVRLSRSGRTSVASVVWELAQTGRTEAAAALLAQWGPSFQVDALYDPTLSALRRTPQFWALMRQKGLVDYWNQSHEWPDFCATEPICTQYLRR